MEEVNLFTAGRVLQLSLSFIRIHSKVYDSIKSEVRVQLYCVKNFNESFALTKNVSQYLVTVFRL